MLKIIFFNKICEVNYEKIHYTLKNYIKNGLKDKDEKIVGKIKVLLQFDENHPWWKYFEEELKDFPEIKYIDLDKLF